jgi:pimeloyl-ACP methyl ester carboxylesterase
MATLKKRVKWLKRVLRIGFWFHALINRTVEAALGAKDGPGSHKVYRWRFGKVSYTAAGEGEPVLLIQGTEKADTAMVTRLAKRYRVYVMDLLGCGRSEAPPVTYSAYLYASLVCDFLRQVIGQPAAVVARGRDAAYALKAYALGPEGFTKILLFNPCLCKADRNPLLSFLLLCPVVGKTIIRIAGFYALATGREAYHLKTAGARYLLSSYFSGLTDADFTGGLAQIKIPIRVVRGEDMRIPYKWLNRVHTG